MGRVSGGHEWQSKLVMLVRIGAKDPRRRVKNKLTVQPVIDASKEVTDFVHCLLLLPWLGALLDRVCLA